MKPISLKENRFILKIIKYHNNEIFYKLKVDDIEKFKKTFQIRNL